MEQLDIYDQNKQPTGRTTGRDQLFLKPGEYHLAVLALILDHEGRYLITRRALSKSWGAGWWELPGGSVQAGESSLQAAVREAREETGLFVSEEEGTLIYSYRRDNPPEEGDNYFVDVWKFVKDFHACDVHVQEEEVMSFQIADADTIASLGKEGIFLHYHSIQPVFNEAR